MFLFGVFALGVYDTITLWLCSCPPSPALQLVAFSISQAHLSLIDYLGGSGSSALCLSLSRSHLFCRRGSLYIININPYQMSGWHFFFLHIAGFPRRLGCILGCTEEFLFSRLPFKMFPLRVFSLFAVNLRSQKVLIFL